MGSLTIVNIDCESKHFYIFNNYLNLYNFKIFKFQYFVHLWNGKPQLYIVFKLFSIQFTITQVGLLILTKILACPSAFKVFISYKKSFFYLFISLKIKNSLCLGYVHITLTRIYKLATATVRMSDSL